MTTIPCAKCGLPCVVAETGSVSGGTIQWGCGRCLIDERDAAIEAKEAVVRAAEERLLARLRPLVERVVRIGNGGMSENELWCDAVEELEAAVGAVEEVGGG